MDGIVQALEAAYSEQWQEIVGGAILIDLLYFIVGGAFYFFLFEKRRKQLSLKQLPRYTIDARVAYGAPPDEHARNSSRIDKQTWVLRFLWAPPLIAIMTTLALALGVFIQGHLNEWFGVRPPLDWPEWAVLVLQGGVILLIGDLGNYWNHRWMHRIPIYWSFHRAHHSPETLNYFTGNREHPLEVLPSSILQGLFNGFAAGLVLWASGTELLPGTLPVLVAFGFLWKAREILYHSHIPLSFGKLDYLIGGPIMHQLHHSAEAHHFSRNFGVQLYCWDWIFGTIYVPAKGEKFRLGLSENEIGDKNPHGTLKGFYWEPVVHAYHSLFPNKKKSEPAGMEAVDRA